MTARRWVAAPRRPWARAGSWLLLACGLASSGAACGETDDPGTPAAAGQGGGSGTNPTGGTAGGAGKAGAGGQSGRVGGAGKGSAGAPLSGQGGASAGGRGGSAGRAGSVAAGRSSAGESNAGEAGTAGAGSDDPCSNAALVWKSANKTNYTSYPDPGSEECIKYNGCMWAGQFAACSDKKVEGWVAQHNIVAAFPDFDTLALHDLCLRKGDSVLRVTVLDTCGDSDCGGCCTENQGSADELIDIESYTNERWGVPDGPIEWADLGPTTGDGCG